MVSYVALWLCLHAGCLGECRVGEASNPGPAGEQVTKRQRQENFTVAGLQDLFARLPDLEDDEPVASDWPRQS